MMSLPDNEKHMEEVTQLAEEARPTVSQATSEPPTRGLFAPIHLAPAHDGIPHEYILHIHTQMCEACGCGEEHSEFFAYYRLRSRMGGTVVTHLRRADRPIYNLPVRRVPIAPTKVPFCSECKVFDLTHLPAPPEESKLTNLTEPTLKNAKPKAEKAKAAPKAATLEDLI